jgi:hypothetical protein
MAVYRRRKGHDTNPPGSGARLPVRFSTIRHADKKVACSAVFHKPVYFVKASIIPCKWAAAFSMS